MDTISKNRRCDRDGSTGAWTTAHTDTGITLSNGFYRLSLATAANDQYEYQLNTPERARALLI